MLDHRQINPTPAVVLRNFHKCPHYHLVPKSPLAHALYRSLLLKKLFGKPEAQRHLWGMCAADPLFYINTFWYGYAPRDAVGPKVVPLNTYPIQDEFILRTVEAIGRHDLHSDKSRDMGWTTCTAAVLEWFWHFFPMNSFLLVSRKATLVDSAQDPDTLFAKFDLTHKYMPKWMLPRFSRTRMHLFNEENGSVIDGEANVADIGRGGRRTAIMVDEASRLKEDREAMKASGDTTDCRLMGSTQAGINTEFYRIGKRYPPEWKFRMPWTCHPQKARGLYYVNGKPRSPAYDEREKRASCRAEMAQEWDMEVLGDETAFFDSHRLDWLVAHYAAEPFVRGTLPIDLRTGVPGEFRREPTGELLLWMHLTNGSEAPQDRRYVVACDVSFGVAGEYTSLSALTIADAMGGEKVGEFTTRSQKPHEFAATAVGICRWLRGQGRADPKLIWETNGPGYLFGPVVKELGYLNVYNRVSQNNWRPKPTEMVGWDSNRATKLELIGDYAKAILADPPEFIIRSLASLEECRQYVFTADGTVTHVMSKGDYAPDQKGINHGDRVIADALAWRCIRDQTRSRIEIPPPEMPEYCFAARQKARQLKNRAVAVY